MYRFRQRFIWRRAAMVATTILMVDCASESSYIDAGRELAAQRQYDAAIQQFMTVIGQSPDSVEANVCLGLVYLELGRLDDALRAIQQARKAGDTEEILVSLAMVYTKKGDFTQATSAMEKATALSPRSAKNHLRLGIMRKQNGELEQAVASFRTAAQLDPQLVEARVELGLGLKELKKTTEALEVLKSAVLDLRGAGPGFATVQEALAEVYEATAMYDYALHTYKLAQKTDPKLAAAVLGAGRVLRRQGKADEAIALLADAAKKRPDDSALLLELGLAYRDYHVDAQAIEALTQALAVPPAQTQAYLPLIDLLIKTKARAARITALLDQASTALPNDLGLQLRAGDFALDRGDFGKALEAYKRALELQPANTEAIFGIGLAQARSGDVETARQNCDVLRSLDPAKANQLSEALEKLGPEKAPAAKGKGADGGSKKKGKRRGRSGR